MAIWLGREMDAVASNIIPRCMVASAQMCISTAAPVGVTTKGDNLFEICENFD